jgi:Plasmid pRiA4b ORF-3-like protein
MPKQVYVLKADLVGFRGIHRTIAIRSDQTLVDVHYALQAAFDWDDDHLYSFWPDGEFYPRDGR